MITKKLENIYKYYRKKFKLINCIILIQILKKNI